MAISDKITSIQNHLKDDWDSVESLIGDTELDKNIENISSALDDLYNDLPKVTGSGTSITLDDTRKGRLESTLNGNTSQYTTTGKNLCNSTNQSTPVGSGIIFTPIYENGLLQYIDVNGTSTSICYIDIGSASYPSGTYTVTGSPSGGSNDTYQQRFVSGATALGYDNGSGTNVTLNEATTCALRIRIANGYTANHLKFYPMIRLSSVTDSTYEPYTGGIASPNPDYPQDIHVVSGDNEIVVNGKNLFTLKNISNGAAYGIERTINNSELKLNGTSSGAGNIIVRQTTGITLGVGTYSILIQRKSGTIIANSKQSAFYFRKPNGTEIVTFNFNNFSNSEYSFKTSFVLSEPTEVYVEIYCNGSGYVFTDLELQFQIEKGSSASTYEPYQCNTYNIDLPVENLFDKDSATLNVGINTSNGNTYNDTNLFSTDYIPISINTTYRANSASTTGNRVFGACYDSNKSYLGAVSTGVGERVFTVTNANAKYVRITGQKVNIDTYQIEKGSKSNSYTPYGTTPIELCKIPNTDYEDTFLHDKVNDKWYLHKEIGKVVLNGSENWFKHGSISSWFYCDGVTDGYFNNAGSNFALCNYFTQNSYSNVVSITNGQFVYGSPDDGTTKRLVIKNTDYTEIADFKTWLSTHNVVVYYVLATPVNTALEDM